MVKIPREKKMRFFPHGEVEKPPSGLLLAGPPSWLFEWEGGRTLLHRPHHLRKDKLIR